MFVLEDPLFVPGGVGAVLEAVAVILLEAHLAVLVPLGETAVADAVVEVRFTPFGSVGVEMNPLAVLLPSAIPSGVH